MKRLLACLLVGCASSPPAPENDVFFRFEGALVGARHLVADDPDQGPRVACVQHGDELVISAVQNHGERHGTGVYLRVGRFLGVGRYAFGAADRAWAFDQGHIQLCTRADDRDCYQGYEGCTVNVDEFALHAAGDAYPSGVRVGSASGRFDCPTLGNANTRTTIGVRDGTFRCRAEDWTRAGGSAP